MARVIVVDSGPLGNACGLRGSPLVEDVRRWLAHIDANGTHVVLPEIADFELRRELIRNKNARGVLRLDALCRELIYVPINTAAMRGAAALWAGVRARGLKTEDDHALGGDVILAAQALGYVGAGDTLTVATPNFRHFRSLGIEALPWESVGP